MKNEKIIKEIKKDFNSMNYMQLLSFLYYSNKDSVLFTNKNLSKYFAKCLLKKLKEHNKKLKKYNKKLDTNPSINFLKEELGERW